MIVPLFLCVAVASVTVGNGTPLEERLKRLVQARAEMEARAGTLDQQRRLQRQIVRIEAQLRKKPDGGARPTFDVTTVTNAVTSDGDTKLSVPQAFLARILPPAPDTPRPKVPNSTESRRQSLESGGRTETRLRKRPPQGQIIDGEEPQPVVEARSAAPAKPAESVSQQNRVGWSVRPPIPQEGTSPVGFSAPPSMLAAPQGVFPFMLGMPYHQVMPPQPARLPDHPSEKAPCSFDPRGLVAVWDSGTYSR